MKFTAWFGVEIINLFSIVWILTALGKKFILIYCFVRDKFIASIIG